MNLHEYLDMKSPLTLPNDSIALASLSTNALGTVLEQKDFVALFTRS